MIKQVDMIVDEVGSGITYPLLGLIGDEYVIIKTFQNRWGNKILVNEFIALEIAKILNLPIPNGGLCIIDSNTDFQNLEQIEIEPESIKGIGFYSKRIEKCIECVYLPKDSLGVTSNIEDISKIIVFDHLIYNKDRHDGNLLVDISGSGNIYIIDHSHIFNVGYNWSKNKFDELIKSKDYKNSNVMKENCNVYEIFINRNNISIYENHINDFKDIIKNTLNKEVFKNIINKIPNEWIIEEDKEGVLNYLMYRLNNIDNICDSIINYLQNPGGECSENIVFDIEL